MNATYSEFGFLTAKGSHMHEHFMPQVFDLTGEVKKGARVLDVGCGNGYTCGKFLELGATVVGIDLSREGIDHARREYPGARFELLGAESNLLEKLGESPFDLVVSTEVVEHLYTPRDWATGCFGALKAGGTLICTTPYHGYLKNLLISLLGKWDTHANPLWDGGHIKLWSRRTLFALLTEAGFKNLQFRGAGRLPGIWMTMIVRATRPR